MRPRTPQLFHLSASQAARKLGICETKFKRLCRDFKVPRWPQRKVTALNTFLEHLRSLESEEPDERYARIFAKAVDDLEAVRCAAAQGFCLGLHANATGAGGASEAPRAITQATPRHPGGPSPRWRIMSNPALEIPSHIQQLRQTFYKIEDLQSRAAASPEEQADVRRAAAAAIARVLARAEAAAEAAAREEAGAEARQRRAAPDDEQEAVGGSAGSPAPPLRQAPEPGPQQHSPVPAPPIPQDPSVQPCVSRQAFAPPPNAQQQQFEASATQQEPSQQHQLQAQQPQSQWAASSLRPAAPPPAAHPTTQPEAEPGPVPGIPQLKPSPSQQQILDQQQPIFAQPSSYPPQHQPLPLAAHHPDSGYDGDAQQQLLMNPSAAHVWGHGQPCVPQEQHQQPPTAFHHHHHHHRHHHHHQPHVATESANGPAPTYWHQQAPLGGCHGLLLPPQPPLYTHAALQHPAEVPPRPWIPAHHARLHLSYKPPPLQHVQACEPQVQQAQLHQQHYYQQHHHHHHQHQDQTQFRPPWHHLPVVQHPRPPQELPRLQHGYYEQHQYHQQSQQ